MLNITHHRMMKSIWMTLVVGLVPTPVLILIGSDSMGIISLSAELAKLVMFAIPFSLCGASTIALVQDRIDSRSESSAKSKSITFWWISSFILLTPINYYSLLILGYFWFLTNWIQCLIYTVSAVYFGLKIFRSKEIS